MMDPKTILSKINGDLTGNLATRVIYLEGETDPPIFFGLLGLPPPINVPFLHNGTLVKGLSASDGSGNKTVRRYLDVARTSAFSGRVFGIVDGDGDELATLAPQFDAPFAGPLFAWKAYSIEDLLATLPWPTSPAWGAAPDWQVELRQYAPYVAINRLRRSLVSRLEILRLNKFWNPMCGQPLQTESGVQVALEADKGQLAGLDVAAEFAKEATRFRMALAKSVQEAIVYVNGKWLIRHFLVDRLGRDPDHWSSEWARHAAIVGGLSEIRDLWERITGAPP